ncbi:MAG: hypothetical protein HY735_34615 [Verrucomicrobia bacterium]|nr:hypothetical protein [Verrucomicrobiota bacterium]
MKPASDESYRIVRESAIGGSTKSSRSNRPGRVSETPMLWYRNERSMNRAIQTDRGAADLTSLSLEGEGQDALLLN